MMISTWWRKNWRKRKKAEVIPRPFLFFAAKINIFPEKWCKEKEKHYLCTAQSFAATIYTSGPSWVSRHWYRYVPRQD
jgi:hypothetical protein